MNSYIWKDERHEGWIAPVFVDGLLGDLSTIDTVTASYGPDGVYLDPADQQERPVGEVTGWIVVCGRPVPYGTYPTITWRGSLWSRVKDMADEDLSARRVFLSEDNDGYAFEPAVVTAAAHAEWTQHVISGGGCEKP